MKIQVEMAFDYGEEHFSSGIHKCNDVNVIRYMRRNGYGVVKEAGMAEEPVEKSKDLNDLTVKELKQRINDADLEAPKGAKRAELIAILEG